MANRGWRGADRPAIGGPTMPADREPRESSFGVDEIFDVAPPPRRHGETASARRSPSRPQRRVWRPLSLVGAALLAAALVGLLDYQPTPAGEPLTVLATAAATPTATPTDTSVLVTPTAEAASALATLGPQWQSQIDLPVLALSPALTHSSPIDPSASIVPSGSDRGPFMYLPGDGPGSLAVIEVGRGVRAQLPLPVKEGEYIATSVTDGAWLAVELSKSESQCAASTPWRILVARLGPEGMAVSGAKGFKEIARGSAIGRPVEGQDCPQSAPPQVQVVAGRIAWVQERADGSSDTVEVRNLGGEGWTKTFSSAQHVVELALSSEAIAWVESSDPLAWRYQWSGAHAGNARPEWVVMVAGLSDRSAHRSAFLPDGTTLPTPPVPAIVLDGSAVVATEFTPDLSTSSVVRADATGATVIDPWGTEHGCGAQGAAGGVVVLTCQWPAIAGPVDGQASPLTLPAVWTATGGLRVLTLGTDAPTEAWWAVEGSGWVIFAGRENWTAVELREIADTSAGG